MRIYQHGAVGVVAVLATTIVFQMASAQDAAAVDHARALSRAFRTAAGAASPAVVTVLSQPKPVELGDGGLPDLLRDPRLRELFPDGIPDGLPDRLELPEGLRAFPTPSSVGSGIVIDSSGIVLTNSHVVSGNAEVKIRLPNGQEIEATDVTADPMSDLAIVRFKAPDGLAAAKLGNSDELEIGDWVIAIGSPFELEATVSAGIISGKGRGIDKIRRGRLLQTDAAINPGNSGGPLVNLNGEVIGINTAIASNSGGYQGIGFAIPINRAKWITRQLIKHGRVRRAYLGIRIGDVTPAVARELKVPVRSGVAVIEVLPDSPAAEAGLKPNDVITSVAGQAVRNARELQDAVEQKPLDSTQPIEVLRESMTVKLSVVLKPLPADIAQPTSPMEEE